MIGAVQNRTENVAFYARLSRPTIKAINNGFLELSRSGVPDEEMALYKKQFQFIKERLAARGTAIGKSGTYLLKYDGNRFLIQYETEGGCSKSYLPTEIQDEIRISKGKIVQFPANQLDMLARRLHVDLSSLR